MVDSFVQLIQQKKAAHDESDLLSRYELPLVTVDIVLLTVQEQRLKVLLIQRKRDPFEHMWALPGGFLHMDESLQQAASRRLREETNIDNIYLQQLGAFGQPNRDPRARVITIAYYALVSSDKLRLEAHANAEDVGWFCITELPKLAFDHPLILQMALSVLKEHLEETPIAFQLLPGKFTLTELQRVYELILDKPLDKRNFRKKILASEMLKETGETKMEGYHRPALLYSFTSHEVAEMQSHFV